jgi:hypothetical protein
MVTMEWDVLAAVGGNLFGWLAMACMLGWFDGLVCMVGWKLIRQGLVRVTKPVW